MIAITYRGSSTRVHPMAMYLLSVLLGGLLTLFVMVYALWGLSAVKALPPPQFSNSLCMDEKLYAMRRNPPSDVNLLVVGSSVAWRHFNSPAAVAQNPGLRPYNAGFCGANIAQSERVTAWLVGRLPTVRHILMLTSPFDYAGCASPANSVFDTRDADAFVFGGAPSTYFYARYFDPATLALNARHVRSARHDPGVPDPLVQNRFGDAPSEPARSRGLFYGRAGPGDPVCFDALHRMARAAGRAGITFDVAMTPVHPAWARRFGSDDALQAGIRSALVGTSARYLGTVEHPDPHSFYDAIHFRWSSTGPYTAALLRAMGAAPAEVHRAAVSSGQGRSSSGA